MHLIKWNYMYITTAMQLKQIVYHMVLNVWLNNHVWSIFYISKYLTVVSKRKCLCMPSLAEVVKNKLRLNQFLLWSLLSHLFAFKLSASCVLTIFFNFPDWCIVKLCRGSWQCWIYFEDKAKWTTCARRGTTWNDPVRLQALV